jgi:hypothetical protein
MPYRSFSPNAWQSPTAWKASILLIGSTYFALAAFLPPRCRVEPHWGAGGVSWFGLGPGFGFFFAALILVLLCSLRFLIVSKVRFVVERLAWYGLLLAVLIPATWFLVDFDWDNEAVSANANWIGTPIGLLFVPTAFACFDLTSQDRLSVGAYFMRSVVELFVLVPIWLYLWVLLGEFLLLGWVGP